MADTSAVYSWDAGRLNPFFVRAWPWPRRSFGPFAPPLVSIPSSSGRGLGLGEGRGLAPLNRVSIPSSSGRGLGPVPAGEWLAAGLNPFFVRAWPWPALAFAGLETVPAGECLNPFFVRAWPWPRSGATSPPTRVSIPSSSGRGLGPSRKRRSFGPLRVSIPSSSGRGLGRLPRPLEPGPPAGLNPFFVRAWPWPARWGRRTPAFSPSQSLLRQGVALASRAKPQPPSQASQSLLRQGVALAPPRLGGTHHRLGVSIPSSSGRGLGP